MNYDFMSAKFKNIRDADNPEIKHNIELNITDFQAGDIYHWYENAHTAEFIMENYAERIENNPRIAYLVAVDIRELMSDLHMSEEDAINHLLLSATFNIEKYRNR